jgi:hypothetical protein
MKTTLKSLLGSIPYTADLYDALRKGRPRTRYNLEQLAAHLPAAVEQVRPFASSSLWKTVAARHLHYCRVGCHGGSGLRGMDTGHHCISVYSDWRKERNPFDLRQDLYTKRVLAPGWPWCGRLPRCRCERGRVGGTSLRIETGRSKQPLNGSAERRRLSLAGERCRNPPKRGGQ